ncbi:hypothetical protein SeMB42_g01261 [Synchytrium endobioticum]|uniref:Uncharacterized protein n=1 Tax=Synchytrium endobioticum TaxID=286115 RepID=A0A507DLV0_9FUNG|nr:hypothetical protein SeMB42_g01261 [Synchytrium endobioticum]
MKRKADEGGTSRAGPSKSRKTIGGVKTRKKVAYGTCPLIPEWHLHHKTWVLVAMKPCFYVSQHKDPSLLFSPQLILQAKTSTSYWTVIQNLGLAALKAGVGRPPHYLRQSNLAGMTGGDPHPEGYIGGSGSNLFSCKF